MKKEFFENLEKLMYEAQDDMLKFEAFANFYEDFLSAKFIFCHEREKILRPTLHTKLEIKEPTKIRRVKNPSTNEALAKLLHSIAHIEYSAIFLALDSAYRFSNLPFDFYSHFLSVANDEIKHFKLLESALNELGFRYGDFKAHDNLQNALNLTTHSLKYRMGVVHRGLEAKGLDANPFVVQKISSSTHPIKNFLKEILHLILEDEIKHVRYGDIWFKYNNDKEDFLDICAKFSHFLLAGKVLNKKARLKAGFSEDELLRIESFYKELKNPNFKENLA